MMLAAEGNHVECLKLLLRGGADKNAADRMGNRAVHRYVRTYVCTTFRCIYKSTFAIHWFWLPGWLVVVKT